MTSIGSAKTEARQTVLIVEDDLATAEALCDLLDSAGVPAQRFASAEEFIEAWDPSTAGCLVLDARLPGMSGIELQARLVESGIKVPIIVITAHGDVPMARKALKTGAVEFLTKPFQDEEFFLAVAQAFTFDRETRKASKISESIRARVDSLSNRERQVVKLVTSGLTNREIADQLCLQVVTVKLYRRLAMKKMGVDSLADLVKLWEKR
jgi:FixJ family two-component response regulator